MSEPRNESKDAKSAANQPRTPPAPPEQNAEAGASSVSPPQTSTAAVTKADRAVESAAAAIASIRNDAEAESESELGALAGEVEAAQKKAASTPSHSAPKADEPAARSAADSLAAIDAELSTRLDMMDLDFGSVEEVLNDVFESESSGLRERRIERCDAPQPPEGEAAADAQSIPESQPDAKSALTKDDGKPAIASSPAVAPVPSEPGNVPPSPGPAAAPASSVAAPKSEATSTLVTPGSAPGAAPGSAPGSVPGFVPGAVPPAAGSSQAAQAPVQPAKQTESSNPVAEPPAEPQSPSLPSRVLAAIKPPAIRALVLMSAPLKYVPAGYRPYVDWLAISLVFWVPIVWGMVLLFG